MTFRRESGVRWKEKLAWQVEGGQKDMVGGWSEEKSRLERERGEEKKRSEEERQHEEYSRREEGGNTLSCESSTRNEPADTPSSGLVGY